MKIGWPFFSCNQKKGNQRVYFWWLLITPPWHWASMCNIAVWAYNNGIPLQKIPDILYDVQLQKMDLGQISSPRPIPSLAIPLMAFSMHAWQLFAKPWARWFSKCDAVEIALQSKMPTWRKFTKYKFCLCGFFDVLNRLLQTLRIHSAE